jgi:hypothetical protein
VAAGEWRDPAEQLVEHDPHAVDVRLRRGVGALGQLRGKVVRRADQPGEPGERRTVSEAGDAEVSEPGHRLRPSSVDEHVLGFDVPVDHPPRVRRSQARQNLNREGCGGGRGQRPAGSKVLAQVGTPDELRDDGDAVPLNHEVPHSDHVGILDAREDDPLLDEAGDERGVGRQFGPEYLGGNLLPRVAGRRPVDDTHGATAEYLVDQIALP